MRSQLRQTILFAAVLLVLATLLPTPASARELQFQASILEHQPTYLLVRTSGNETLRFELDWFKNTDGYALNRDESYCFEIEQLLDGKLMLVSVQSCDEQIRRRRGTENEDSGSREAALQGEEGRAQRSLV